MAILISAAVIVVLIGGYLKMGHGNAQKSLATTVPVAPKPPAPAFAFSKAVVWQSDAITSSTGGFDTKKSGVAAAITKDASDMQAAGVKWARWWVGPAYPVQQVSTVAKIFQAHGVTMILDVNAGIDSGAATESGLEGWLSSLVPVIAGLGEHYWEIGNEPNIDYRSGGYWSDCGAGVTPSTVSGQADVAAAVGSYVVRLKDAYSVIHRADTAAMVSSAGLSYDPSYSEFCEIPSGQWIAALLQTAAWRYMDCFGIHPYADSPADVVAALASTRQALDANRLFAQIPFCITEVGFQTSKNLPESERATEYVSLMNDLEAYGVKTPVFWYNWYDYKSPDGYGIVQYDGLTARTYLPIYSALRNYKA